LWLFAHVRTVSGEELGGLLRLGVWGKEGVLDGKAADISEKKVGRGIIATGKCSYGGGFAGSKVWKEQWRDWLGKHVTLSESEKGRKSDLTGNGMSKIRGVKGATHGYAKGGLWL